MGTGGGLWLEVSLYGSAFVHFNYTGSLLKEELLVLVNVRVRLNTRLISREPSAKRIAYFSTAKSMLTLLLYLEPC